MFVAIGWCWIFQNSDVLKGGIAQVVGKGGLGDGGISAQVVVPLFPGVK